MPVPTTKVELQRFLVMVNYLGKFIPHISDETAPRGALLKNETEFRMQKLQLDSFDKRLISSVPVVQFVFTQTYPHELGQVEVWLVWVQC